MKTLVVSHNLTLNQSIPHSNSFLDSGDKLSSVCHHIQIARGSIVLIFIISLLLLKCICFFFAVCWLSDSDKYSDERWSQAEVITEETLEREGPCSITSWLPFGRCHCARLQEETSWRHYGPCGQPSSGLIKIYWDIDQLKYGLCIRQCV